MSERQVTMPSEVSETIGLFDRFATTASNVASRATFFVLCVALVLLWAPSIIVLRDIDTWQLIINTATTIVTFLMVALLQNSQTRSDQAIQHKLNAIADGLADLMAAVGHGPDDHELSRDVAELRHAVGLERRESSAHNGAPTDPSAGIGALQRGKDRGSRQREEARHGQQDGSRGFQDGRRPVGPAHHTRQEDDQGGPRRH